MLDKLAGIKRRFEEIGEQMTDPEIIADMKKFVQLNKDYRELEPLAEAHDVYKNIIENINSSKEILKNEKDEEFREMAREELNDLVERKDALEEEIRTLLIPKDPQDAKNSILEIRAGTGGDEASIFAGDLFRMYQKFCETKGWKFDVVDMTEGTVGGFKEVIINVSGKDVYGTLKYESGVHRVQRVPQTETQGRVHTSAATVAVLPEAEEFDIDLNPADIRKDTYCSSGPGGQSVNTTYSAIRLTHAPTGIVVTCQDEKSQLKNLDKAMKVLRSRIYELEYAKYMDEISSKRKTMVSTGDRSAKIRTYNYPQGRVTDHRINLTLYNLSSIVNGDIQEIIDKLQVAENYERLKEQEDNL
ncbi:MAG: peptide chain release factor 1 [Bacteroidota bacterium]